MHKIRKSSKQRGERVIIVNKWYNTLSFKIVFILILSGFLSITCYGFFRYHSEDYYSFLRKSGIITFNNDAFVNEFQKKAKNINLYSENKKDKKKLKKLLKDHDAYTSINLYDTKDMFLKADMADFVEQPLGSKFFPIISQSFIILQTDFEQVSYDLTTYEPVQFKDADANVMVTDFHTFKYSNYYFYFTVIVCLFIFLLPTLLFIRKKVKYINHLKNDLLILSQGNLDVPVHIKGKDELAILAKEIDSLRISLDENIQKEEEARKANKELITSLSHDIRTPLTTLRGYLDILYLKRYKTEEQFNKYLLNCMDKVDQIKELSNKTFEYALVFESQENFSLKEYPSSNFKDYLENQIDFLRLQGFHIQEQIDFTQNKMNINFNMMKRTLNNLCSNIIKYADKEHSVIIHAQCHSNHLKLRMSNEIKPKSTKTESNQIGLKSVKKVIELHHGTFYKVEENNTFIVVIDIPC